MKLTNETIAILKNFSSINQNFYSDGDTDEISTWTITKNIYAKAKLDVVIPKELAIYDLPELLSVVDFYKDGDVDISLGDKYATVSDGGTSKVKYAYSSKEILSYPTKDLNIDDYEATFPLTKDAIQDIMKASSILGAPDLEIKNVDGSIVAKVFDKKVDGGSEYEVTLGTTDTDFQFNVHLRVEYLKLLPKDYIMSVPDKALVNLKSDDGVVEYYIAIESTSVIGKQVS